MSFGTGIGSGSGGEDDVATEVSDELVADASAYRDATGTRATTSYIVSGVVGDDSSKYVNPLDREEIPNINDEHTSIKGIFVTSVSTAPVVGETETWLVTVQYSEGAGIDTEKGYSESEITIGTTTEETTTNKDGNGDLMSITTDGAAIGEYYATSEVTRFRYTINISRTEKALDIAKHRSLLGKVNSDPWFHGDPYTWMCTNIDVSENHNEGYDVTYEFAHNESTWRFEKITYGLTGQQIVDMFDVYATTTYAEHDLLFGIEDDEGDE